MQDTTIPSPLIVVGAGLGGLAAAVRLARSGRRVRLLERRDTLGGLALTEDHRGYLFNLGPRALYRAGAAARELRDLGVVPRGEGAAGQNGFLMLDGRLTTGPFDPMGLLRTSAMSRAGKWELVRRLAGLGRERVEPGTTMAEWLATRFVHADARAVAETIVRLTTYANDPGRLCAGAGVAQLAHGMRGVDYLHGGWQQLVDALAERARAAGVQVETNVRVTGLVQRHGRVLGVRTKAGVEPAEAVVVTSGPKPLRRWLDDVKGAEPVARFLDDAMPARLACLDVALRRLPRAVRGQAPCDLILGVDEPIYASVHSAHVELAPAGGAVVHLARYLAPDESPDGARGRLEEALEVMQPGYAEEVEVVRYRPRMVATTDVPVAGVGLTGRPSSRVVSGLYVAGDWVGPEGMLADAVFASARAASDAVVTDLGLHAAA